MRHTRQCALRRPIRSFCRHTGRAVEIAGTRIPQGRSRHDDVRIGESRRECFCERRSVRCCPRQCAPSPWASVPAAICVWACTLATLEIESLLKAMVAQVDSITTGVPEVGDEQHHLRLPITTSNVPRAGAVDFGLFCGPREAAQKQVRREAVALRRDFRRMGMFRDFRRPVLGFPMPILNSMA